MIDLYSWPTSNGRKASIMLEETGLEYEVHPVDLSKRDQKQPEYLAMNPNGRIPTIVDRNGPDGKPITIFESGAILWYLAEKAGMFLPRDARGRTLTHQWLMFQMSHVGPSAMEIHHMKRAAGSGSLPPGFAARHAELERVYGVLEQQLSCHPFLAGDYSIADIATYPWVYRYDFQEIDLNRFPALARWFNEVGERPAVQRGLNIPPRTD